MNKSELRKLIREEIESAFSIEQKVEQIKNGLAEDYDEPWEDFVDDQSIGECQSIVSSIVGMNIHGVKKCFGEIEVDEPYTDEEGDEQELMTHHWVKIDGQIFDFSKGTLIDFIQWDDVYDPSCEDESRYHQL